MYDVDGYVYKQIDDSWIALITFGILILISSIITIVVLCLIWHRNQQGTQQTTNKSFISNNKSNGIRQIPVQHVNNRQSKNYETQKIEIFVPPSIDDTTETKLDEIHARFKPQYGIQHVQQFYPRINKAYF